MTLLGDAAHLVPPIGVGVNLAMLDGYELALALTSFPMIDEALVAYEATMLPRSTDLAEALTDQADFLLQVDDESGVEDRARELQEHLEMECSVRNEQTAEPTGAMIAAGSWDLTFTTGGGAQTDPLILVADPLMTTHSLDRVPGRRSQTAGLRGPQSRSPPKSFLR